MSECLARVGTESKISSFVAKENQEQGSMQPAHPGVRAEPSLRLRLRTRWGRWGEQPESDPKPYPTLSLEATPAVQGGAGQKQGAGQGWEGTVSSRIRV